MHPMQSIYEDLNNMRSDNILNITFFGKTGVGKTSTINTLFGLNWDTDNVEATTTSLHSRLFKNDELPEWDIPGDGLNVTDTPGIGESEMADDTYFPLYRDAISRSDCLVWLFQADTRVYRPDQTALKKLSGFINPDARVIFGLNRIDEIGPDNWNFKLNRPSEEQEISIREKIADVCSKFSRIISIGPGNILPYSAKYGFGLQNLRRSSVTGSQPVFPG